MTYIKLFLDYLDAIEPLGDAERGRLFTSLMQYAKTGEAPQLGGNERFLFPMMRAQIDRDNVELKTLSEERSKAGKKGAEAKASKTKQNQQRQAKPSKSSEDKEKDKDKEEDKDNYPPLPPQPDYLGFSPELAETIAKWTAYRKEMRKPLTKTGRETLLKDIRKYAAERGEPAVVRVIEASMSNGWQGLFWNKLDEVTPSERLAQRGDVGWMKDLIRSRERDGG